jgi:hypothetical protein
LKDTVLGTLRTTWTACEELADDLTNDPGSVWRYPPLIAEALRDLQCESPSIEARSAEERMAQESANSVTSTLASVNAAVATGAGLAGAAPHILLALACASAVLGIVDTVEQFFKKLERERVFRATLDPNHALCSEPGYGGLIASLAFALLDLQGVRAALRSSRFIAEVGLANVATGVVLP